MGGRSAALVTGLVIAAAVATGTPATAAPLDKGHLHDVVTNFFDCDGTPVQEDVDAYVNFVFNQRGSSPFPYYRESVHGTVVTTNLETGGTFTSTVFTAGGARYYDQNGKLVLKDPGQFRFAIDVDHNGTPGNPDDDQEVADSFRVVRDSTGRNDTEGREFCADVVEFTS